MRDRSAREMRRPSGLLRQGTFASLRAAKGRKSELLYPSGIDWLSLLDRVAEGRGLTVFYQRSFAIERRLEMLLHLIQTGRHSSQSLAEHLGVSVPTVSR